MSTPAATPPKPWRVLHIEDDRELARMIEIQVRQSDAIETWTLATSMADAAALRDETFDIILLDYGLPDSQGIACLSATRDAFPETPILILTANIDLEVGRQSLAKGADDYLVKNEVRGSIVARTMGNVLARRHLQDRLATMEDRARQGERAAELSQFMNQLINQMSHALATPLTPLSLDITMLKPDDATKLKVWNRCLRNVTRLQRAVSSLSRVAQRVQDAQDATLAPLQEFIHIAAGKGSVTSTISETEMVPAWWGAVAKEIIARGVERGTVHVQLESKQGLTLTVEDTGGELSNEELHDLETPLGIETGQRLDPGVFLPRKMLETHGGFLRVEANGRRIVAIVPSERMGTSDNR